MEDVYIMTRVTEDLQHLIFMKGGHRYVWQYTDFTKGYVYKSLCSMAENPELNLTWYDASVLAQKVRHPEGETVT